MPMTRQVEKAEALNYANFDKFRRPPSQQAELDAKIEAGVIFHIIESSFSDPGDDWSILMVDGHQVCEMSGY